MLSIMPFVMQFSTFFSLFLSRLSHLPPLHSHGLIPELPQTTFTAELLGAVLNKFPYHHMPPWDTDSEELADFVGLHRRAHTHIHTRTLHTKQRFSAARCDNAVGMRLEKRRMNGQSKEIL